MDPTVRQYVASRHQLLCSEIEQGLSCQRCCIAEKFMALRNAPKNRRPLVLPSVVTHVDASMDDVPFSLPITVVLITADVAVAAVK